LNKDVELWMLDKTRVKELPGLGYGENVAYARRKLCFNSMVQDLPRFFIW